jgi:hypothetical protein
MERITGPAGETLYVDQTTGKRGVNGKFVRVYTDDRGETHWGYLCRNCETADTAVDSMGRVECNSCQNRTKPEEWDAAHE